MTYPWDARGAEGRLLMRRIGWTNAAWKRYLSENKTPVNAKPMTETYRRLPQQITNRGPWQQTSTGHAFLLADPRVEEVRLDDMAFALSRQTRYNGHMSEDVEHYSIAQHEVLISRWMEEDGHSPETCFAGLHHDSPEYVYGDFISQVKYCVPEIRPFTEKIDKVIFEALGVKWRPSFKRVVKNYDMIAMATEVRDLMAPNRTEFTWGDLPESRKTMIKPWSAWRARTTFLQRHYQLASILKDGSGWPTKE